MNTLSVEGTDAVRSSLIDHARLYDVMVQHKSYFHRIAYSILHQTEDAEDAVQAAYLSAWTGWANFHSGSSVKTWLTTIVMNKALTELRTKRRRSFTSIDDDPVVMVEAEWQLSLGQVTPEQYVMREQAARRAKELLADLPKQTQGIVTQRYMQEFTVDEIARANGTSKGAVKSHLHRGCKAMRKSVRLIPKRPVVSSIGERGTLLA
jgi:RNA polymerase sigma-70 factor (ECF subfamily)